MTDKLATKEPTAVAIPTAGALELPPDYFAKNDRRGFEDTVQSDVLIPRLALAQALSPQVTDGDPNRIQDLKVGDLFNSVTNQVYGREVFVQLLRKMPLRAMEFNPIDSGGGVKDPDVPLHDERCKWHGDEKPVATVFRDFIAVLLPSREIIALSFKSSGIKVAKALWGLATMRNKPVFAGRYQITTGVELKPKPHQVYKVQNAGNVTLEDARLGEEMYESVRHIDARKIDVAFQDTDFDPEELERQSAAAKHDADM